MDSEYPTSIALQVPATQAGAALPVSLEPLSEEGAALPAARAVPLHKEDPALAEERQTAARIVQGIRHGDSGAETALVERYSKGLRYLLMRRMGDEEHARDLLQDTFYIAIAKLRETEIENPARLAGYLRGIAIRVALNAGRRRNREPYSMEIGAIERIPDCEPRQFEHVAREQTLSAVQKLLKTMPVARDREILTRFYVRDQDKKEICSALGLDSLHFNRVLFRAKRRFRKLLEKSGHADDFAPT
ncbi:MAG: RNA polymerase sigma factor [Woeseiaceae bacterium]